MRLMADALRAERPRHRLLDVRMGHRQAVAVGEEHRQSVAHDGRHLGQLRSNDKAHDWAHPVPEIVDLNEPLWPFAGPGHWNDRRHARGRQWRNDADRISLAFLALGDDGLAADGRQRRRAHGRKYALDPAQQGSDRGRSGRAWACRDIACGRTATAKCG